MISSKRCINKWTNASQTSINPGIADVPMMAIPTVILGNISYFYRPTDSTHPLRYFSARLTVKEFLPKKVLRVPHSWRRMDGNPRWAIFLNSGLALQQSR